MAPWSGFCGPAYKLDFQNAGPDEAYNLYTESVEKGPRAGQLRLRQIPGLKNFGNPLPTSPIRGMWAGDNRLFVVAGGSIYEVYQDGSASPSLGNVGNGTNPATIVSNGIYLALASAGQAYISAGPLVAIPGQPSDPSFVPIVDDVAGQPIYAATMAFIDQYFIAAIANSKQINISGVGEGDSWDPGDFATKEAYSDNIQRVWVDFPGGELVFLFGAQTQEIWQDTGGLFPFTRISGAVFPIGCDSAWSVDGANGIRFWFWNQTVWKQVGTGVPTRISDYGLEQAIKGFPAQGIPGYSYYDLTNCEGACYLQGGHLFYHLSFPQAGVTWCYDDATGSWHKRAIWQNSQWGRYRPRLFAEQWGLVIGGDYATGQLYVLDPATFTDAGGVPLRRDRIAPYMTDQMRNMRYDRFTLDLATGVGLQTNPGLPGQNPQVAMRYSANRGNTWSNWRQETLGQVGQYDKRVFWSQMGSSRIGMTVHTSITDPIDTSINAAYIDIGQGTFQGRP